MADVWAAIIGALLKAHASAQASEAFGSRFQGYKDSYGRFGICLGLVFAGLVLFSQNWLLLVFGVVLLASWRIGLSSCF